MRRLIVILLISWAYVGCGPKRPASPGPTPAAGIVRVAVDDTRVADALLAAAVGEPLSPVPRSQPRGDAGTAASSCGSYRVARADAPGGGVDPRDVIAEWERRLRDPGSAAGWLLAPVEGVAAFVEGRQENVAGIAAEGPGLVLCTAGPVADLPLRLSHPALWYWERDSPGGPARGPGPFTESASGALVPNPGYAGPVPLVSRIERVVAGDAALLLELDEVDVALVYGQAADRLLVSGPPGLGLERAPAWDRRFALWMNPRERWLNDPRFRRWIGGALDRQGMLEYLFAGRGEPLEDLLARPGAAAPPVPAARPVSPDSVPRFALAYDMADRDAERIAGRVKARLRTERVEVTLLPRTRAALLDELRAGRAQAAVLSVEPYLDDPVLALRETCALLGPSAAGAALVLDQAGALGAPAARLDAALAAEDILLRDALVAPIVRVHAWLATRAGLVGVRAGPRRVLRFDEAGWSR